MMGAATFAIGLLPGYATIGLAAPLLLVLLRLIQGFALGGEWGGAVLIVSEHGDPARRGYWASWPQAGVPVGQLLANGLLALLAAGPARGDVPAWGWRVPFLLSALLVRHRPLHPARGRGVAGVQGGPGRRPSAGRGRRAQGHMPIIEVFRRYPREVFTAMGARFAENVSYYIFTIVITTYAERSGTGCRARSCSARCSSVRPCT